MQLKDLMVDFDLWSGVESKGGFTFIVNPTLMNARTVIEYGERVVSPSIINLTEDLIIDLIVNKFESKWNQLLKVELDKLDLLSDTTKFENKTGSDDKQSNKTDVVQNQITGYNSDELITEGGNNSNTTGGELTNYSEEVTSGNYSIENLFNNLNEYQKTNILDTSIKDVVNYLTLSIY